MASDHHNKKPVTAAFLQAIDEIDCQHVEFAIAHRSLMAKLQELGVSTVADEMGSAETLRINIALRREWQFYQGGIDDLLLYKMPAQELFSLDPSKRERIDWRERWIEKGGQFFEGRMIALKSDLIWCFISDLQYPFPPFAHYSAMGVRAIKRTDAMRFGLADEKTVVKLSPIKRPIDVAW